MGYIVFTYTFHLWGGKKDVAPVATHAVVAKETVAGKSMPTRSRISAGLLMFRRRNDEIEVLLAHPGGPLFVRKDDVTGRFQKVKQLPVKIYCALKLNLKRKYDPSPKCSTMD